MAEMERKESVDRRVERFVLGRGGPADSLVNEIKSALAGASTTRQADPNDFSHRIGDVTIDRSHNTITVPIIVELNYGGRS